MENRSYFMNRSMAVTAETLQAMGNLVYTVPAEPEQVAAPAAIQRESEAVPVVEVSPVADAAPEEVRDAMEDMEMLRMLDQVAAPAEVAALTRAVASGPPETRRHPASRL